MKKSIFILTAIALLVVIINACNNNNPQEPSAEVNKQDSVTGQVERGSYLANHVAICMDCHSQRDFTKFSGPIKPGTEGIGGELFDKGVGIPGQIISPNITPAALSSWTDQEIIRAFTGGIRKNGDTLFPLMPYMHYNSLDKEDVNAIVAYVRSLKPVENQTAPRNLLVPISAVVPHLPPVNLDQNKRPDPTDKIKYGEYITNAAACFDCHTPMTQTGFEFAKAFGGGQPFTLAGFTVRSANITPDSATGIGGWTEEAFVQKFKTNSSDSAVNISPGKFNTIMPWTMYGKMKEDDLRAVYAYLKSVPAIKNKIEKWPK